MRQLLACILTIFVWPASGQPPSRGLKFEQLPSRKPERRALLIGNNDYQRAGSLSNSVKDARDLEAALKKLGFFTTLLIDANAADMRGGLSQFAQTLQSGDIAFFFYAGHGVQIDGLNYMIPVDFSADNETSAKRAGLDVGEAQAILQRSGAGLTVMVIDACRDNTLGKETKTFQNGFAPMRTGAGGLIAFSTGPGQWASDGDPGTNGLYTSRLLRVLPQPLPLIGVFRRVRDMVYEASNGAQRPYVMEDVIGDYYLTQVSPQADSAQPVSPDAFTSDAQSAINRGLLLFHTGNFAAATEAFEQARRIRPTDAFAYNAAGLAYAKQGKFQIAADLFSKAISLNPAYAAAYFNRGSIYLTVPNYLLAAQDFSWAVDFDPNDPVAFTQRGRAYIGARQYESASADFRHALELYPADVEAHHGLGVVAYRLNSLRESLAQLSEAIALKSDLVEAYEDRARTYQALQIVAQAEQDRRTATRLRGRQR